MNKLLLFFLILIFSSCAKIEYKSANNNFFVAMSSADKASEYGITVSSSLRKWFLLWGFVPLNETSLDDLIKESGARNGLIRNIKIEEKKNFVDVVATLLTLGIVSPYTIKLEGEVVPE